MEWLTGSHNTLCGLMNVVIVDSDMSRTNKVIDMVFEYTGTRYQFEYLDHKLENINDTLYIDEIPILTESDVFKVLKHNQSIRVDLNLEDSALYRGILTHYHQEELIPYLQSVEDNKVYPQPEYDENDEPMEMDEDDNIITADYKKLTKSLDNLTEVYKRYTKRLL